MAAFLDSFEKSEGFDLLIGRWNTDYPDPDNIARSLFHSEDGSLPALVLARRRRTGFSRTPAPRADPPSGRPSTGSSRACSSKRRRSSRSSTTSTIASRAPRVRGLALRSSLPSVNYAELGLAEAQGAGPGSPTRLGRDPARPAGRRGEHPRSRAVLRRRVRRRRPLHLRDADPRRRRGPDRSLAGGRVPGRGRRPAATASACATTSASTTGAGSGRGTCATRSRGCCSPAASRAGCSRPSAAPARS